MLVIGAVEMSGRENNARRRTIASFRSHFLHRAPKVICIDVYSGHVAGCEQFREQPRHHSPVFQHIGDA